MNENPELNDYEVIQTAINRCSSIKEISTLFDKFFDELKVDQPEMWHLHAKELYAILHKQLYVKYEIKKDIRFMLASDEYQHIITQSIYNLKAAVEKIETLISSFPWFLELKREVNDDGNQAVVSTIIEREFEPVPKEKIIFWGTPSEFGYLIHESVKKHWLKLPIQKRGGNRESWRRLANLLSEQFYVTNQDGTGETSPENLYNEILKPSLTEGGKAFLQLKENRKFNQ